MIPQQLRKELGIGPKTRLAIFSREGKLVAVKVEAPTAEDGLKDLFREIDDRYKSKKRPTENEILREIQACRMERRSAKGA